MILSLVKEDIEKDRKKAKDEEELSQKDFDEFKDESETQIKDLEDDISELEGTKGDKESDMKDTKENRLTSHGELEAVMEKIKDAAGGCDFMTVNFDVRKKNRQIEIDG